MILDMYNCTFLIVTRHHLVSKFKCNGVNPGQSIDCLENAMALIIAFT